MPRPRSSASCPVSTMVTGIPAFRKFMAMPPPIVPAPITPTLLMVLTGVSFVMPGIFARSRSAKKRCRRARDCGESFAIMNSRASAAQPSVNALVLAISARSMMYVGASWPLCVFLMPCRAWVNSSGVPPSTLRSLTRGRGRVSAMPSANLTAPASRSPSTISSTRPSSLASVALMGLPDSIISRAFCAPTTRGRRWVPPAPGSTPSFTSGRPICASLLATR